MAKICHMTSAHQQGDNRIFYKECISLAEAGHEVYLVIRGESSRQNGVTIIGVGQPSGSRLSRMTTFAKKVYEAGLAIDADVYHFHDPELLPYGLKLRKKGKHVIFDSHEFYSIQIQHKPYLSAWCAKLIAFLYLRYEHYVLKRLDAVVVPCTLNGKNPFENYCRRVCFVDNSAKLEQFYDHYKDQVHKIPRQICITGSISEDRGVTAAIRAAYQADCKLILAGNCSSAAYEQSLRAMPEFACVEYRGYLAKDEVLALLQESQIGVSTLLNRAQYWMIDVLATKIGEYMSMGLPIIMNDAPYNRRINDQYHFGICVDPEDVDALVDAIHFLLDNPEEARRMGENGRRAIRERFNWQIEEKKLIALYEDILQAGDAV